MVLCEYGVRNFSAASRAPRILGDGTTDAVLTQMLTLYTRPPYLPFSHASLSGVTAVPFFVGQDATLSGVADHADHIARIAGKSRVAIGTDFDGFLEPPIKGIEDVAHYRNLVRGRC